MKCAKCGRTLKKSQPRYITKIVSYAAYDPLEISFDDLRLNIDRELARILASLKRKRAKNLTEDIIKTFQFDLCPACRKKYIKDPLGG